MRYSPARPIAELMVAALNQHRDRLSKIDSDLQNAIIAAGEAGKSLTVETLFTVPSIASATADDLRRIRENPALHAEPIVSQARRAQAAFVRAHDDYLGGHSDIKFVELHWAELRLRITQDRYNTLIHAHPTTPRAPKLTAGGKAVREPRLANFSPAEQDAIKQYIANPDEACAKLETIIKSGLASGDEVRSLFASMLDPNKQELINRWLTHELREEFSGAPKPLAEPEPDAPGTRSSKPALGVELQPVDTTKQQSSRWPTGSTLRQDGQAADDLLRALEKPPPSMVELFVAEGATIRLKTAPKATVWQQRFAAAIDHPDVQRRMRALLESRLPS